MMTEEQHRKQIADQVRHRLQTHPALDESKIDDMLNLAYQRLRLAVLPGRSGVHVKPTDLADFIADLCKRPGFRKDQGRQINANPEADSFSEAEFRALPPIERLKLANRGVQRTADGRIHKRYSVVKNDDGSFSTT